MAELASGVWECVIWGCSVVCLVLRAADGVLQLPKGIYFYVDTLPAILKAKTVAETLAAGQRKAKPRTRDYLRHPDLTPHVFSVEWEKIESIFPNNKRTIVVSSLCTHSYFINEVGTMRLLSTAAVRKTYRIVDDYDQACSQLFDFCLGQGFPALIKPELSGYCPRVPRDDDAQHERKRGRPRLQHYDKDTPKAKRQQRRDVSRTIKAHTEEYGVGLGESLNHSLTTGKRCSDAVKALLNGMSDFVSPNVVKKSYVAIAKLTFPPIWRVLLGKDSGVMSFGALGCMRREKRLKQHEPPRDWVEDYQGLVNEVATKAWNIMPQGGNVHPIVFGDRPGAMSNSRIAYTNIYSLLAWDVYSSVVRGRDLRPFIIPDGGQACRPLVYKLSFDTTQTGGKDMFMMGVIPHTFPVHKLRVQSAANLLVLCLARIAEDSNLVQNGVPGLGAALDDLHANGVRVQTGPDTYIRVAVEFHVAADLKALWLALGLDNFACPCCMQSGWEQMQVTVGNPVQRVLQKCLGVPQERIHLCALHGTLRIVERLLKNACISAYGRDNQKRKLARITELKEYLVKTLGRNKFVITLKLSEVENHAEMMEVDGVYDVVGSAGADAVAVGRNVSAIIGQKFTIRLSSLTGAQAALILRRRLYVSIVKITEGDCTCAETREAFGCTGPPGSSKVVCRHCGALEVWEMFATTIHPLLELNGTPLRLSQAVREDRLDEELEDIRLEAERWLTLYVVRYGRYITPYVHVIGKHLHTLLAQPGNTVGGWAQVRARQAKLASACIAIHLCRFYVPQQGFEAAHKMIRRILRHGSSQGGGRDKKSVLIQIMQHLFRLNWCRLRAQAETARKTPALVKDIGEQQQGLAEWLQQTSFDFVDAEFKSKYPERDSDKYVESQCYATLHDETLLAAAMEEVRKEYA